MSSPETSSGHHDEGHAHLAQPLVGDADHRGLLHGGVPQQGVLDLGRVGVEPPDDEHVLDPPDDAQAAGVVHDAEVARAEPAVGTEHLGRLVGVVQVAGHDAAAAEQHLARLPGLDVAPTLADDAHLEARARPAHGGGDRLGVVVGRRRAGGAALREPVPGDDLREGELVVDPADQLDGDVGRAGHRHAQGGEVVPRRVGVVEDRLVQRRRPGQDGDAAPTRRGPGTRSTSKTGSGSMVAPLATLARMPALRPNMWK